jgi:hypothetical protein
MNTKCKICNKGNGFTSCCGHDKESGEKIITIFQWIKNITKHITCRTNK